MHFHPMFYRCIMGKKNHFYFILLTDNHFFYCCLDQIWVHILVHQKPTGGSTNVGREFKNAIHFCPVFYRYIMDKKNHLQLSLASREPFLLLPRQDLDTPFVYCFFLECDFSQGTYLPCFTIAMSLDICEL